MEKPIKLFLGCGPFPIHKQHLEIIDEDWILIDKYVEEEGITKMDAENLEYEDNTVDEIYNSHILEHISYRRTIDTLREWYRVLKPGGRITINVPDFEWACERWLANYRDGESTGSEYYRSWTDFWQIFFGSQEHEGEYHKVGFTAKSLTDALQHVGFKNVEVEQVYEAHDMQCLIATAEK